MAEETKMLEVGMVGGGLQSFMGGIHIAAIKQAGNVHLKAGAFGATYKSSYSCLEPYGILADDMYPTYRDFLREQRKAPPERKVDFITAVLPNTMHYPIAMTAMEMGIPILGEKPFVTNLDEAKNLVRKHRATGVPYRVAMVYPAYSMLVKARKMLKEGAVGTIRKFFFSMQSGWMARRIENQGCRQALWRTDARRNGPGGVVADSGPHCQFTMEWLTGYHISEVCCAARPCVPGRLIADDATVLVRTREKIDGVFMLSQIATGHREGLTFEITGDKAAMIWRQCEPGKLKIVFNDGMEKVYTDSTASGEPFDPNDFEKPYAANAAYVEALARVYREFAESLQGKKRKIREADDRILGMTIDEALRSVVVTDAIERSYISRDPASPPVSKWVPVYDASLEFKRTGVV